MSENTNISTNNLPGSCIFELHYNIILHFLMYDHSFQAYSWQDLTFSVQGCIYLPPIARQPLVGQVLLIVKASQTLRHITFDRTPLDEWSVRRRAPSGTRTRNPSKGAATDPRLRRRCHWDRQWRALGLISVKLSSFTHFVLSGLQEGRLIWTTDHKERPVYLHNYMHSTGPLHNSVALCLCR